MKQTNGALTLLLKAYRSVFRNAYFKGIASAVILTAGLAAGTAQAATNSDLNSWISGSKNGLTLNSGDELSTALSGGTATYNPKGDLNLSSGDASVSITTSGSGQTYTIFSSGGRVMATGGSKVTFGGAADSPQSDLKLSFGSALLNTRVGSLYTYGEGSQIVISGQNAADTSVDAYIVSLMGGGDLVLNGGSNSGDATLTFKEEFNQNNGTVYLNGSDATGSVTIKSSANPSGSESWVGQSANQTWKSWYNGNRIVVDGNANNIEVGKFDFSAGTLQLKENSVLNITSNELYFSVLSTGNGNLATIDVASGAVLNLNSKASAGAVTSAGTVFDVDGTVKLNEGMDVGANVSFTGTGTIEVAQDKTLKFSNGVTTDSLVFANSGTMTIDGSSSFAAGTVENSGLIKINSGITSAANLDELLKVEDENTGKVSIAADASLKLTDAELTIAEGTLVSSDSPNAGQVYNQGTIDASSSTVTFASNGTDGNVLNMAGKVVAGTAVLEQKSSGEPAAVEDFVLQGGELTAVSGLKGSDGDLLVSGTGILNLAAAVGASGTVSGISVFNVASNETAGSALNISGTWDLGTSDIIAGTSGSAAFTDAAVLNVGQLTVSGGKLSLANSNVDADGLYVADGAAQGAVTLSSSTLTVTDSIGVNVSGALSLTNTSTLSVDYDLANAENGGQGDEDKTDDGLALGSFTADASSTLLITGYDDKTELTMAEYKAIRDSFVDDDYTGLFRLDGVTVSNVNTGDGTEGGSGTASFEDVLDAEGLEGVYSTTTVTDVSGSISGAHDWGSAQLAGTGNLTLAENGGVTLNQADAFGNLISSKDGDVAGAVLDNGSVLTLDGSGKAGAITAAGDGSGSLSAGGENVTVASIGTDAAELAAVNVNAGELTVSVGVYAKKITNASVLSAANIAAGADGLISSGILKAQTITSEGDVSVTGRLAADRLTLAGTNGTLSAGSADSSADVVLKTLDLNGGMLLIDPSYEEPATWVTVTGDAAADSSKPDVIDVGGSVGIGMNSVGVFGADKAEAQSVIAALGLINNNDALSDADGEAGSVMYLGKTFAVGNGDHVLVNSALDETGLENAINADNSSGSVIFEKGTALIISDEMSSALAYDDAVLFDFDLAASEIGSVTFKAGSKIILDSSDVLGDAVLNVADFGAGSGTSSVGDAEVSAAGGLLVGRVETMNVDGSKIVFKLSDRADDLLYTQNGKLRELTKDVFENADSAYSVEDAGVSYIAAMNSHRGGQAVEETSNLAVYGGAVQTALLAAQSSADAISDRLNGAAVNSSMIFADNAQGGGMWFMPIYRTHDSDSFDADGNDYGADINLYGAALGADYTTDSGLRLGAMFNIGSGDADGQGVGSDVSNDFDYYGVSFYAGFTYGSLAITGDLGYTRVANDLEQDVNYKGFGKLDADPDADVVSVGLRGDYRFDLDVISITPHAGLRYTSVDLDGYSISGPEGTIAATDSERMDVFSIPVGVTFAKDFTAGTWTVKPVLDLTITANAGDTEFDSDTIFSGTDSTLSFSSEVMDDFTYQGSLGLAAKYGESLGLGLNVSYVGSDNADEFGVTGSIRYMF